MSGLKKIIILIGLISLFLIGCAEVEIEYPPIKMYESDLTKEDYTFSNFDGTLAEPVPSGEILYTSGELAKDRYESIEGELGIKVERILRGDAAKYRIIDRDDRDLPTEDEEWVMVELEVYNFGNEEETLVFGEDELGLYTLEGQRIPSWDVNLDTAPTRVVVYEGKPEKVVLLSKVSKSTVNFLVGFSKLIREYELIDPQVEEPEIGETLGENDEVGVEEDTTEPEQVETTGTEEQVEQEERDVLDRIVKYLETKDVVTYRDFFQEE